MLSQADVQLLWQHMFGARGRDCMADLRVKMLRKMCEAQGSREVDGRLLTWLSCHEDKYCASLASAVVAGESSDDQE